jgi:hypothetical protein
MHPSGYRERDFHASITYFIGSIPGKRLGDAGCAFWYGTEGILLERFRYGHAFKHGQLPL